MSRNAQNKPMTKASTTTEGDRAAPSPRRRRGCALAFVGNTPGSRAAAGTRPDITNVCQRTDHRCCRRAGSVVGVQRPVGSRVTFRLSEFTLGSRRHHDATIRHTDAALWRLRWGPVHTADIPKLRACDAHRASAPPNREMRHLRTPLRWDAPHKWRHDLARRPRRCQHIGTMGVCTH